MSPAPGGKVAVSLIVPVVLLLGATYGEGILLAQRRAGGMGAEEMAQVQPPKQFHGRLPAYYGKVVNERQREQIYAIQRHYFVQIEDLKAKLEAVTKKRDAEVSAVLSPQQQAEIEGFEAVAKAKRDAKKKMGKGAKQ